MEEEEKKYLECRSRDGVTYRAGHLHKNVGSKIYGVIYKSYRFFDSVFEDNNGFVDLTGPERVRMPGSSGHIYASIGETSYVNIGKFYQDNDESMFALRRGEWLAMALVSDKKPALSFFVAIGKKESEKDLKKEMKEYQKGDEAEDRIRKMFKGRVYDWS